MNRIKPMAATAASLFVVSSFATPAFADAESSAGVLPPVVVTPARTAQTVAESLSSVAVITREEIEQQQAVDTLSVLSSVPGVDRSRAGGPGQQSSVFIRAGNSDHTLVLMDGVPINPGSAGAAASQNLHPAFLERIEVVRGPAATLHGSDALGGAINLITVEPDLGTRGRFGFGLGRYGREEQQVGVTHRDEAGGYAAVKALRQRVDGFPAVVDGDEDSGFDNDSMLLRAGMDGDQVAVDVSHFQAQGEAEYYDTFSLMPLAQDFKTQLSRLSVAAQPRESLESRVTLSRYKDDLDQLDSDDFVFTERYGVDWQNDFVVGPLELTAGIQAHQEDVESLSFGTAYETTERRRSAYLQAGLEHAAHRVEAGGRYVNDQAFSSEDVWSLGYAFQPNEVWQWRIRGATAYKAPDATERFGFGGNPDLDPEKATSLEAGVRVRPVANQRIDIALFETRYRNLITYDGTQDLNVNVGRARVQGVELGWQLQQDAWRLRAEAHFQDPENRDDGERLARRTRASGLIRAAYDPGPWAAFAEVTGEGSRQDLGQRLSGFGLVNVGAQWRMRDDMTLRATVENLLDKDYTIAEGYNTAGQAGFISFTWTPEL